MKQQEHIIENQYDKAKKKVTLIKGFYRHLFIYLCVCLSITLFKFIGTMTEGSVVFNVFKHASLLFLWIPWGIGLLIQGMVAFDVISLMMGKGWEERKVQKILEQEKEQRSSHWE